LNLSAMLLLVWLGVLPAPEIGRLKMPPQYWLFVLEAAADYRVDPYVVAAVMAIESRYDAKASSEKGRCYGLMQLDRDVARGLGVDRRDPRENIRGGARILARLLRKHQGDLAAAVREYNGTGNRAYLREVLKAVQQARQRGRRAP